MSGPYSENPVERYYPKGNKAAKKVKPEKLAVKRIKEKQKKDDEEDDIIKCPHERIHLRGSQKGQVISFAKFSYGELRCPLSMGCSTPCEYKKPI